MSDSDREQARKAAERIVAHYGRWDNQARAIDQDALTVARAYLALLGRDGTCPRAGYDELPGESRYCLECSRQWYGDDPKCADQNCPFRVRAGDPP